MSILRRIFGYRFMDAASDGAQASGGGGGGGDGSPPPAGAAAAAAPAGTGTEGAAAEPSLLSQGADEAAKDGLPAAGGPKPEDKIPEKYRVYEGEGDAKKLNAEASWAKVADAHAALEKRAGELGLPPEKPADYKLTLPEGSTLKAEDFEGPQMDAFKEAAHKAGYTQKQFDAAAAAHMQGLNAFVEGLAEKGATMAKEELGKDPEWQGANLQPQLKLAFKTFNAFATKEEAAEIDRIGNNPVFLKILARIGKDLGEDRLGKGTGAAASLSADTIAEYTKPGSPYWDATHPDHKKYKDVVTRHYQATYGTAPIAPSRNG